MHMEPPSSPLDAHYRPEYHGGTLPDALPATPWGLVEESFRLASELATAGELHAEPSAITLATVDADGLPDARIVLARGLSPHGLTVYSDSTSEKANQLGHRPVAAVVAYWPAMHRQLRFRGTVTTVAADEADEYFQKRPRRSQIAASVSLQSSKLASRRDLLVAVAEKTEELRGHPVETPASWVGYTIVPHQVEIWLGDSDRLHDRARYTAPPDTPMDQGEWTCTRLMP